MLGKLSSLWKVKPIDFMEGSIMTERDTQSEIVLKYYVSRTSTGIESGSKGENTSVESPELISQLREQLLTIAPDTEIRESLDVITRPRSGYGYDGLYPGLEIHSIIIPVTLATAYIVIPIVKAWLERLEKREVEIKRKDGKVIELKANGFSTKEVLQFLEAIEKND